MLRGCFGTREFYDGCDSFEQTQHNTTPRTRAQRLPSRRLGAHECDSNAGRESSYHLPSYAQQLIVKHLHVDHLHKRLLGVVENLAWPQYGLSAILQLREAKAGGFQLDQLQPVRSGDQTHGRASRWTTYS
eukprot:9503817-Pyramimonas_sp.AAC.6